MVGVELQEVAQHVPVVLGRGGGAGVAGEAGVHGAAGDGAVGVLDIEHVVDDERVEVRHELRAARASFRA